MHEHSDVPIRPIGANWGILVHRQTATGDTFILLPDSRFFQFMGEALDYLRTNRNLRLFIHDDPTICSCRVIQLRTQFQVRRIPETTYRIELEEEP